MMLVTPLPPSPRRFSISPVNQCSLFQLVSKCHRSTFLEEQLDTIPVARYMISYSSHFSSTGFKELAPKDLPLRAIYPIPISTLPDVFIGSVQFSRCHDFIFVHIIQRLARVFPCFFKPWFIMPKSSTLYNGSNFRKKASCEVTPT